MLASGVQAGGREAQTTSPLVLASGSPRRQELLALLGLPFRVEPADVNESVHDALPPWERAARLAEDKARAISSRYPGALVIGADTLVVIDEHVLGKPADAADARRMLELLSGRTHQVITGIAVAAGGQPVAADVVATDVTFRSLSAAEIDAYVATEEPMDKAGAYAIQGYGAVLIAGIRGDHPNVVGLPLTRLATLLRGLGVTILGEP
jgi:septum formation protein